MKLALFEDDQFLLDMMPNLLASEGHEVVLICDSLSASREALQVDASGVLVSGVSFDTAIVDGNLSPGYSGQDGVEICTLLKLLNPRPMIIGNSGGGRVVGADHQSMKDISLLLKLLQAG